MTQGLLTVIALAVGFGFLFLGDRLSALPTPTSLLLAAGGFVLVATVVASFQRKSQLLRATFIFGATVVGFIALLRLVMPQMSWMGNLLTTSVLVALPLCAALLLLGVLSNSNNPNRG